jgi:hypothetical protein
LALGMVPFTGTSYITKKNAEEWNIPERKVFWGETSCYPTWYGSIDFKILKNFDVGRKLWMSRSISRQN